MLLRTSFEILSDRPGATAHGGLSARARITFNLYGSCRAAAHAPVVVKRGTVGAGNTNTSDVPAFEANFYFRSALEAVGPSRLTPFRLHDLCFADGDVPARERDSTELSLRLLQRRADTRLVNAVNIRANAAGVSGRKASAAGSLNEYWFRTIRPCKR